MLIKCLGPINYKKGTMVIEEHKFEAWQSGQVKEVDTEKGHYLIARYKGHFEEVKPAPVEKKLEVKENKMLKQEEVK